VPLKVAIATGATAALGWHQNFLAISYRLFWKSESKTYRNPNKEIEDATGKGGLVTMTWNVKPFDSSELLREDSKVPRQQQHSRLHPDRRGTVFIPSDDMS
jgi:hypothetical protein